MKADPNRTAGLTLLELMIIIVMMGMLISIATLNASRFLAQHRLSRAARQLATDLRLARTKAITQTRSFHVVFTTGGATYTVDRLDAGGAWQPHALYAKSESVDAPAPLPLPEPVTTVGADTVEFQPRGNADATHTIQITDPGLPGRVRNIQVSFAGKVTIQ